MKQFKPLSKTDKKNYIVFLCRCVGKTTGNYKKAFSDLYRAFWKLTGINVNQRVKNRKIKLSKIDFFLIFGFIDQLYSMAVDMYKG